MFFGNPLEAYLSPTICYTPSIYRQRQLTCSFAYNYYDNLLSLAIIFIICTVISIVDKIAEVRTKPRSKFVSLDTSGARSSHVSKVSRYLSWLNRAFGYRFFIAYMMAAMIEIFSYILPNLLVVPNSESLMYSSWVCVVVMVYYVVVAAHLIKIVKRLRRMCSSHRLTTRALSKSEGKELRLSVERGLNTDSVLRSYSVLDVYFYDMHLPLPTKSNLTLYYILLDMSRDIIIPTILYLLANYSLIQNGLCLFVELALLLGDFKFSCKQRKSEILHKRVVRSVFCIYIGLNMLAHLTCVSETFLQNVIGLVMGVLITTLLLVDIVKASCVFFLSTFKIFKYILFKPRDYSKTNPSVKRSETRSVRSIASPPLRRNIQLNAKQYLSIVSENTSSSQRNVHFTSSGLSSKKLFSIRPKRLNL